MSSKSAKMHGEVPCNYTAVRVRSHKNIKYIKLQNISVKTCGKKGIETVYGEEKNILYLADYRRKNLWYWHVKPIEPTKEGPLSYVLFESPFNSQLGPPLSSLSSRDKRIFLAFLQFQILSRNLHL